MADFDSSLPIRTQANGDAAVKVVDGTLTSRQLTVNADGSVNITDNGGSLTVDGTVAVSNLPATVDTNYGTVGASTIRSAAQLGNATGAANFGAGATGAQTLRVEANQGAPNTNANGWFARITNGTNNMGVNADGSINVNVSGNPVGSEINSYQTNAAVAAAGTSNHDYTVTVATTLYLKQILASASGKIKIEVQVETGVASGTFNTRFVGFSSVSNPNISIVLEAPIAVAAGVRVRVIRTNLDLSAQDIYSTICGQEV